MTGSRDLTRNEGLVLGALRGGEGPLTAYQLLEELRGEGLRAPPQVYRALKSLEGRGLVHKLDSRNAFLACTREHAHHGTAHVVIFLVCDGCDDVEEVCDPDVDRALRAVSSAHGFASNVVSAEVRGRCRQCVGETTR